LKGEQDRWKKEESQVRDPAKEGLVVPALATCETHGEVAPLAQ
jgi:hypothetical protein